MEDLALLIFFFEGQQGKGFPPEVSFPCRVAQEHKCITNVYITDISLSNEKGGIQITLFLCPRACEHHSPSLPYSYFLARVPVAPDICFCSTLEEETVRLVPSHGKESPMLTFLVKV